MQKTVKSSSSDRNIFAVLIILCLVPIASGANRMISLASQGYADPENVNYLASPGPIVVHMVAYVVFCLIGTFQIAPKFRARHLQLHRIAGRLLVPIGIAAALTGIWMTLRYPPMISNGEAVGYVRLVFGSGMVMCLLLGASAIKRRDFVRHQTWMLRSLAIAFGASTQALVAIPWFVFIGEPQGISWAVAMLLVWLFNLAVAEFYLSRQIAA